MAKHHNDPRRGQRRGGRRRALLTSTTLAVAMLIASPVVRAKEEAATPPGGEGGLEEIVVTGTATAGGLKKMDTSFSVTSPVRSPFRVLWSVSVSAHHEAPTMSWMKLTLLTRTQPYRLRYIWKPVPVWRLRSKTPTPSYP